MKSRAALPEPRPPVNRYLTSWVFPEPMARAWIVHNVEEVGVLEHLLPDIVP